MLIAENSVEEKWKKLYSLQSKKIGIPIFQRFYAWKEQQVKQLLEDIVDCFGKDDAQLYLLDFIYYKDDEKIMLADGQQRIVSVNNLIKAINDVITEKSLAIDKVDLFDISYDVVANDVAYKRHFEGYPSGKFKKVYLEMKKFVEDHIDNIEDIIDIIKNKIYIYLKSSANPDDAFLIFQQINTGGKPLTKDEIIKTALDQYSKTYHRSITNFKLKNIRQYIGSYYKLKTNDSNKNFDNIAIISFIKEYISKDRESFNDFIDTCENLSRLSNNPFTYVISYINRSTLLDVLNILAMKRINITRQDYTDGLLMPLCLMSIILTMNGGSPTSYRYLLTDIIDKIKNNTRIGELEEYLTTYVNDNNPAQWKITRDEFKNKLGDPNISRNLKKALMIMDIMNHSHSGTLNVEKINLEHVFPQKPDNLWVRKGWASNRENQLKLIDNIGNYILLAEEVNKRIKNKYITDKMVEYDRIIPMDRILQTEINTMDFERFKDEKDDYINERKNKIAEIIRDELPLGSFLIVDHIENPE